jgi:hypothetical protein
MNKYPQQIESNKGYVLNSSNHYNGLSITLMSPYGEVILTAASMDEIQIQSSILMPTGFTVDQSKVQETSIFSRKVVTLVK